MKSVCPYRVLVDVMLLSSSTVQQRQRAAQELVQLGAPDVLEYCASIGMRDSGVIRQVVVSSFVVFFENVEQCPSDVRGFLHQIAVEVALQYTSKG